MDVRIEGPAESVPTGSIEIYGKVNQCVTRRSCYIAREVIRHILVYVTTYQNLQNIVKGKGLFSLFTKHQANQPLHNTTTFFSLYIIAHKVVHTYAEIISILFAFLCLTL